MQEWFRASNVLTSLYRCSIWQEYKDIPCSTICTENKPLGMMVSWRARSFINTVVEAHGFYIDVITKRNGGVVPKIDFVNNAQSIFYDFLKYGVSNDIHKIFNKKMAKWTFFPGGSDPVVSDPFDPFVASQKTATVGHAFRLPGCVMAAVMLLWFDGFCTAARFGKWAKCKFCSHWLSDCSIQHMSRCPILKKLGHLCFDLPEGTRKVEFFVLSDELPVNIIKRSIHIYIIKRTFDALRHNKKDAVETYKSFLYSFMVKYPSFRQYVHKGIV